MNTFHVYLMKEVNTYGMPVAEIPSTKKAILQWVKYGGVIPTHMGELRKTPCGYVYYTTIGQTYEFKKVRRF